MKGDSNMEKILKDFTGKKISLIKKEAREMLVADFLKFLSQKYETVMQVGAGEVGVVVGTIKDEDGFEQDVVVTAKAIAKPFYDKSENLKREVCQYDIFKEAREFNEEQEIKKSKRKTKDTSASNSGKEF